MHIKWILLDSAILASITLTMAAPASPDLPHLGKRCKTNVDCGATNIRNTPSL